MVKCEVEECKTIAKYGIKQEFAIRCKKHAEEDMVFNSRGYCSHEKYHNKCENCKNDLTCDFDGCEDKSTYGVKQRFPTRCKIKEHREEEMVLIPRFYCYHNRYRSVCKDCNGSSICEHGKQRSKCKDCEGSSICEHGKERSQCKDCDGSSICEHGRQRCRCRKCDGSTFCGHGKRRNQCKECDGAALCSHQRQKNKCLLVEQEQINFSTEEIFIVIGGTTQKN